MTIRARYWLAAALAVSGCGSGKKPVAHKDDASVAAVPVDAPRVAMVERPLGMPDAASFLWRKRAGQDAFRDARKAESKGDWAGVVTACNAAIAKDPNHLEAQWLLAAALAQQGKLDELVAPLQAAVAGDLLRWGNASLTHPAFHAFMQSPAGEAWAQRVAADRDKLVTALANSVVVLANGDLYAVDVAAPRWYRLTRTNGGVIAALPAGKKLAFVSHVAVGNQKHELGVGLIDLARAEATKPVAIGTVGPATVALGKQGFLVGAGKPLAWRAIGTDRKLEPVAAKDAKLVGPRLDLRTKSARAASLPLANVTADWDAHGLASAMRLAPSNRVVSVPVGLIDGNTATWSPTKTHLAFIAQLDDACTQAAAYVTDASTGVAQELARSSGHGRLSLQWTADRTLAIATNDGVSLYSLDGATTPIPGAQKLAVPPSHPKCVATPDDPEPDEDDAAAEPPNSAEPSEPDSDDSGDSKPEK
ncbi:MAG TPA: hypothetical protein VGM90_09010 [Kofleriaceae bacterium]